MIRSPSTRGCLTGSCASRLWPTRVGCSGPGAAWGEMGEVFGMLAVCIGIRDQEVPLSLWPTGFLTCSDVPVTIEVFRRCSPAGLGDVGEGFGIIS